MTPEMIVFICLMSIGCSAMVLSDVRCIIDYIRGLIRRMYKRGRKSIVLPKTKEDMFNPYDLGRQIREAREKYDLTVEDLSLCIGMDPAEIKVLEDGNFGPSRMDDIETIKEFFDVWN